ncbi:MAG: acetylornithine deacetylase [Alphaproteobacteria bacterium]|nr:acetylornithine deacetylase [Alphaproteobacteria bacterium]
MPVSLDVVDALSELVAFPTVSDRPVTELAAWLAQHAEDVGMRVERFETSPGKVNVVASAGPAGTDGLCLSGHMDVVPVDGQDWTSDPFRLREDQGRLYGRGSCDMKAFLAATTVALHGLDLSRLQRELVLVWTHDEEVGCHGSRTLADRLAAEPRTLPSACIIGEPTAFRICRAHPGHTTVRIDIRGVAAHSSRPQLGVSAIALAGRILVGLERLQDALAAEPAGIDPLVLAELPNDHAVLNCGHVHGGSAVNIVADHCTLKVGIRPLPGQPADALVARIDAVVQEAAAPLAARGASATTTLMQSAPALLTPADTDLQRVLAAWSDDPRPTAAPFATDGGNLARVGAAPLVFGPGSIDVAHKPDEYVPEAALRTCVDVVTAAVRARCGDPRG